MSDIDVAVLGRVGIDLYPNQLRTPLREVRTYTRFVGGFAGNVATGLARLGLTPAIVSRVGPDPHGEFVRDFLSGEGVDVRFLAVDERLHDTADVLRGLAARPLPDHLLPLPDRAGLAARTGRLRRRRGRGGAASARNRHRPRAVAESRDDPRCAGAHRGTTIFDLDWRPTLWERRRRVRGARSQGRRTLPTS